MYAPKMWQVRDSVKIRFPGAKCAFDKQTKVWNIEVNGTILVGSKHGQNAAWCEAYKLDELTKRVVAQVCSMVAEYGPYRRSPDPCE